MYSRLTTRSGQRVLVNMDHVAEVYEIGTGAWLYFAWIDADGGQALVEVKESLDAIWDRLTR